MTPVLAKMIDLYYLCASRNKVYEKTVVHIAGYAVLLDAADGTERDADKAAG